MNLEQLYKPITNLTECGVYATYFSIYVLMMFWHLQLFRRVFRLKQQKTIISIMRLISIHTLMLVYVNLKISPTAYALIGAHVDYEENGVDDD